MVLEEKNSNLPFRFFQARPFDDAALGPPVRSLGKFCLGVVLYCFNSQRSLLELCGQASCMTLLYNTRDMCASVYAT